MKIMGMGINYSTGRLLVQPLEERAFAEQIIKSFPQNEGLLRILTRGTTTATTFRAEQERKPTVDLGDPLAAGWTFLVNESDPRRAEITNALRPLAEHRGMKDPASPLIFRGEREDEWHDWMIDNYYSLAGDESPHYVLVAGSPIQIPFHFQAFMGSAASVGRVDFDKPDDLEAYVRKIVALEKAASPVVTRQAIFFATDHGLNDPTFFSRLHMAEPLAKITHEDLHIPTQSVMGEEATKSNFLQCLRTAQPALVYTASHGLGAPNQSLDFQKKYNGGICCEHAFGEPAENWLLSADDVGNDSFLEGAVFFQFACFGYGTPAQSDFMHWQGDPGSNSSEDFVAALPKKLLAHPRGPIAFIGHCDTAWLHGFDDPQNPNLLSAWHQRLEPFLRAVRVLLGASQPVGLAMADMSKRYDLLNARLTMACDSLQKKSFKPAPDYEARLAQVYIFRNDAQNYMVFGDPAVRLRIP